MDRKERNRESCSTHVFQTDEQLYSGFNEVDWLRLTIRTLWINIRGVFHTELSSEIDVTNEPLARTEREVLADNPKDLVSLRSQSAQHEARIDRLQGRRKDIAQLLHKQSLCCSVWLSESRLDD